MSRSQEIPGTLAIWQPGDRHEDGPSVESRAATLTVEDDGGLLLHIATTTHGLWSITFALTPQALAELLLAAFQALPEEDKES